MQRVCKGVLNVGDQKLNRKKYQAILPTNVERIEFLSVSGVAPDTTGKIEQIPLLKNS
jgi:hypothetical protein